MNKEDYFKYYIQGSDHYLIPKYVFDELFNEMSNWKEESQRQKEVIDKAIEWVRDWTHGANDWFEEDSKPSELLDILKEVSE